MCKKFTASTYLLQKADDGESLSYTICTHAFKLESNSYYSDLRDFCLSIVVRKISTAATLAWLQMNNWNQMCPIWICHNNARVILDGWLLAQLDLNTLV